MTGRSELMRLLDHAAPIVAEPNPSQLYTVIIPEGAPMIFHFKGPQINRVIILGAEYAIRWENCLVAEDADGLPIFRLPLIGDSFVEVSYFDVTEANIVK